MRTGMWLVLVGIGAVGSVGCSLDIEKSKGGALNVIIEDTDREAMRLYESLSFNTLVGPSTASDFGCFAVNVAGQGIPSQSERLGGCTLNTPVNIGILSDLKPRGGIFQLDVPTGKARAISIIGVFPASNFPECGGTDPNGRGAGAGYFIGSKTIDLVEPTSVTIPISYSGASPDISCLGNNETIVIGSVFPSGGANSTNFSINTNNGTWFGSPVVTIGGLTCTSPSIDSTNAHTLHCTTPSGGLTNGTSYDVVATNGDGKQLTVTGGWTQVGATSFTTFTTVGNGSYMDVLGHVLDFRQVPVGSNITLVMNACNFGGASGTFFSGAALNLSGDFSYPANSGAFPGIDPGDPNYGSSRCASGGSFNVGGCCKFAIRYAPTAVGQTSFSLQFVNTDTSSTLTYKGTGI